MKENNVAAAAFVDYSGVRHCRLAVSQAASLTLATRLSVVDYSRGLEIGKMRNCIVCWKKLQRRANVFLEMLADEALPVMRWKTSLHDRCARDEGCWEFGRWKPRYFFSPQLRALVLELWVLCRANPVRNLCL